MEVVLVMFKAGGERRRFPLTREVTVIGRREDCDLRIPLTEVSRKHCRLVRERDHVRLEDLGSSNGTYHNGSRIQECALEPGDSLQVGPVIFTVQVDGFPADEDIHPHAVSLPEDSSAGGNAHIPNGSAQTGTGMFSARPLSPEDKGFTLSADENDSKSGDDVMDILGPSPEKDDD